MNPLKKTSFMNLIMINDIGYRNKMDVNNLLNG